MSEEIDHQRFKDAWDRIARTEDGQLIYRHLQRIRMGMAPSLEDGALRHCEGRRSLAADLMAHMAKGIEQSDRYAFTFAVAQPAAVSGARGAGRRITAGTFVPGWDGPEPGAAGDSNAA